LGSEHLAQLLSCLRGYIQCPSQHQLRQDLLALQTRLRAEGLSLPHLQAPLFGFQAAVSARGGVVGCWVGDALAQAMHWHSDALVHVMPWHSDALVQPMPWHSGTLVQVISWQSDALVQVMPWHSSALAQ